MNNPDAQIPHIVYQTSPLVGQPCPACGVPFQTNEAVVVAPSAPAPGPPEAKPIYIHPDCARAADA